jgi:transglutaminase-like putative cysteine protease
VLWVLCGLALVVLPHLARLPGWLSFLLPLLWAWRGLVIARLLPLPGRLLLSALTVIGSLGVFVTFGVLWGRDAGVALLNLMLGLKLLELSRPRDAYIAVLLAFFVAITHFLYSQSIPMALYALVVVVSLVLVLMEIEQRGSARNGWGLLRQRLGVALRLVAQAAPLAVILFLFFPRISGPLWQLPLGANTGVTGLSESMAPGAISQLSRSDAIAFRVKFQGTLPETAAMYWRGPILGHFDGVTWRPSAKSGRPIYRPSPPGIRRSGPRIDYLVTMEPHDRRWVFALDLPLVAPPGTAITENYQVLADRPIHTRRRYLLASYLDYGTPQLNDREWYTALQLPERVGPRTADLVDGWLRASTESEDVLKRAVEFFRTQPFVYTLTPPLLGSDPVEEFLFRSRAGFCEHFSSAFTLLMRLAGIPARVVTGYQGGERNPVGDYVIVRQSDAHAWSEVWLDGKGWTRVDPTAAVAPERVQLRIDPTFLERGAPVRFSLGDSDAVRSLLRQVRYGWDAVNNGWNQWVLGYSQRRQEAFLAGLGLDGMDWRGLGLVLVGALGGALGMIALAVLGRRTHNGDPVGHSYERFCGKLAARGLTRRAQEGPVDFSRRVAQERPELAGAVARITALYVELQYGRAKGKVADLQRVVRQFQP